MIKTIAVWAGIMAWSTAVAVSCYYFFAVPAERRRGHWTKLTNFFMSSYKAVSSYVTELFSGSKAGPTISAV